MTKRKSLSHNLSALKIFLNIIVWLTVVKILIESSFFLVILSKPKFNDIIYQQLTGSLIYAMICTHSNIFHIVSVIAHHITMPSHIYIKVVKCIFYYLHSTLDYNYKRSK